MTYYEEPPCVNRITGKHMVTTSSYCPHCGAKQRWVTEAEIPTVDDVCVSLHTAFRKASDSTESMEIHSLINLLGNQEWHGIVKAGLAWSGLRLSNPTPDPYIYETVTKEVKKWNPDFPQALACGCGHPYERHFDGYDDNAPIGCKYCECWEFHI